MEWRAGHGPFYQRGGFRSFLDPVCGGNAEGRHRRGCAFTGRVVLRAVDHFDRAVYPRTADGVSRRWIQQPGSHAVGIGSPDLVTGCLASCVPAGPVSARVRCFAKCRRCPPDRGTLMSEFAAIGLPRRPPIQSRGPLPSPASTGFCGVPPAARASTTAAFPVYPQNAFFNHVV